MTIIVDTNENYDNLSTKEHKSVDGKAVLSVKPDLM